MAGDAARPSATEVLGCPGGEQDLAVSSWAQSLHPVVPVVSEAVSFPLPSVVASVVASILHYSKREENYSL